MLCNQIQQGCFLSDHFIGQPVYSTAPEQTINKRNNKKDKSITGQQPGLVADADASL